ncbi:MAG: ferrous iron transport protein B [Desulfobacteraceae bacterium]|jgi:ferrous iron transport protein B
MLKRKITIALSGNPNSGKTTIFNAITGARQHIANYPGVTVEKKYGRIKHKGYDVEVVDLPGTYSLTAYSLEEIVARDFLINERPDLVVDIVDASNLDRNLYLAVQFKELGVPLIIALNMIDVAETRGIMVDQETLSTLFGVPVVPTVARSNKGIYDLLDRIVEMALKGQDWQPAVISYGADIDQGLNEIEEIIKGTDAYAKRYPPRWLALKCMEGDDQIVELIKSDHEISSAVDAICAKISKHLTDTLEEAPQGIIAEHRYGHIAGITKKSVKRRIESRLNLSDRIDKVLTNRIIGPLIMMLILYGIYEFTFWVSEGPVSWLEVFFGWLKGMVSFFIPEGILHSLIVAGIIDGVGGILGFIPLIMFMFFAIAIMEDSGYMARVAYMLDRVLSWFGLHGNSVMALLVSGGIAGGCAVPGVMATRTLRDPKERIATLLVVPFMNCGAKLPVFAMLIAAFFAKKQAGMMFIFTLLSWSFALFAAKMIRSTVLKGPKTPFVMELPPYRAPTLKGLIIHTWERTWQFVKRAGTFILAMSILLWAMMTFPGLSEKQLKAYEEQRLGLRDSFLALPEVKAMIKDEKGLEDLDEMLNSYRRGMKEDFASAKALLKNPLFPLAKTILAEMHVQKGGKEGELIQMEVASAYLRYKEQLARIDVRQNLATLKGTIAGRIGQTLEHVTSALGFDYRTNIALIGGFAAKEVVVSTLGTAYSLGEVDPEKSGSLSEKLKADPHWNSLVAFTLILFTMLYVPCLATVISIKKESSWRWAGFSVAFNLIAAYLVCLAVYQIGSALGLEG